MADPFLAECASSRGPLPRPAGRLQRPADADLPEHGALLAARNVLRRGRQEHLRPARPPGPGSDPPGAGAGLTDRVQGEQGGTDSVTLLQSEIPVHSHQLLGATDDVNSLSPINAIPGAAESVGLYRSGANSTMGASALLPQGASLPHNNRQPYLAVTFIIALSRACPARGRRRGESWATPFFGEIRMTSFNFPPKGWAQCNGQLLPINQNQALFSILGTTIWRQRTDQVRAARFARPRLVHAGGGHALRSGGRQECQHGDHVGNAAALPFLDGERTPPPASPAAVPPAENFFGSAWTGSGGGRQPAGQPVRQHAERVDGAGAISGVGGSQPHENRQPFAVVQFIIALQGIFPSHTSRGRDGFMKRSQRVGLAGAAAIVAASTVG